MYQSSKAALIDWERCPQTSDMFWPRRLVEVLFFGLMTLPVSAADLSFEGGGERMVVEGQDLREVSPQTTKSGLAILFRMGATDAKAFSELTDRAIGLPLTVSICGREVLRPIVQERIESGQALIPVETEAQALAFMAVLQGDKPCPESN